VVELTSAIAPGVRLAGGQNRVHNGIVVQCTSSLNGGFRVRHHAQGGRECRITVIEAESEKTGENSHASTSPVLSDGLAKATG